MNIIHVNNCDLMGRRFNGHDLQLSLNKLGHKANQFVVEKQGKEPTTISLTNGHSLLIRSLLNNLEHQLSMTNLLYPFGKMLMEDPIFKSSDIIHYHLIHNNFISILDFPNMIKEKPSIWTVHDPWLVTGHCIHPKECMKWKTGCFSCTQLSDEAFPMQTDKASQIWKIKQRIYGQIDIDIVVANQFMEQYVKNSPLTQHFTHIHKIPFGIEVEKFQKIDKVEARNYFKIPLDHFVIAFRSDTNEIKGLKYIIEMLNKIKTNRPITLLTIGGCSLPSHINKKYSVIELGWKNDFFDIAGFYSACDVFLMPSLAESFGLMAIEAMAAGRPIVVFENTVLPEITFAPECGIAVTYKDSNALRLVVEHLMHNPREGQWRGEKGKELASKYYSYQLYVNRHLELYEEVLDRRK